MNNEFGFDVSINNDKGDKKMMNTNILLGELRSFDEVESFDHILTITKESYFTACEQSALEDMDFIYLMEREKFAKVSEETLWQIVLFYQDLAKRKDENIDEYYEALWDEFFPLPDNILMKIAGEWMFERSVYLLTDKLFSNFNLFKKTIESTKSVFSIDDSVFYSLTTHREDPRIVRTMVKHYGKENMLMKAYEVMDKADSYYEDYIIEDMNHLIRRIKRFK